MKISRARVAFQIVLHVLLIGHVLAYYYLDWKSLGALDFQSFFHHFLGLGVLTAGALLTLLAFLGACIFGRLFCSWGCHFGATQDFAAWLLRRAGWQPPHLRTRFLHWLPYVLLIAIFLDPVLRRWTNSGWGPLRVDMAAVAPWDTLPGWFLSIATFLVCGGGVLLFLGTRGFCRFVCPYGAVFRVADRVTPFRVRRVEACSSRCAKGGGQVHPCTAACPTAIDVHAETDRWGQVRDVDCVRCHLCIEACPSQALAYRARGGRPASPPTQGQPETDALRSGGEEAEGPAGASARDSGSPGRPVYSLALWAESVVLTVSVVTYLSVDLVYGGHFLAACLALSEGFLVALVLEALTSRRGTLLGFPLRRGRTWTMAGITACGALALTVSPVFSAGAFKWSRAEALRLDPAAPQAPGEGPVVLDDAGRERLRRAAALYERALRWIPSSRETHRLLISAYVRLGDGPRARAAVNALVRSSPPQDAAVQEILDWVQGRFPASSR